MSSRLGQVACWSGTEGCGVIATTDENKAPLKVLITKAEFDGAGLRPGGIVYVTLHVQGGVHRIQQIDGPGVVLHPVGYGDVAQWSTRTSEGVIKAREMGSGASTVALHADGANVQGGTHLLEGGRIRFKPQLKADGSWEAIDIAGDAVYSNTPVSICAALCKKLQARGLGLRDDRRHFYITLIGQQLGEEQVNSVDADGHAVQKPYLTQEDWTDKIRGALDCLYAVGEEVRLNVTVTYKRANGKTYSHPYYVVVNEDLAIGEDRLAWHERQGAMHRLYLGRDGSVSPIEAPQRPPTPTDESARQSVSPPARTTGAKRKRGLDDMQTQAQPAQMPSFQALPIQALPAQVLSAQVPAAASAASSSTYQQ
eukprot:TRINITY_DN40398_c0_g1_i1.p2 TRINITY_DN40398_c0_g1~~TRINITY_DN40398_c0_g1_i1.p2  ORF type:complete len:368 (+),score=103.56 TRINITY_DN40398_c0_g1_i1:93-1196(+)